MAVTFRTTDDRGRACAIPDPGLSWLQARAYASTRELDLDRVRDEIKRIRVKEPRRSLAAILIGVLSAALVMVLGVMIWHVWPGWPIAGGWGAFAVLLGILAGSLFLAASRPPLAAEVAARIARCRLCVSCGYNLEGLPIAPDGCAVCPECGAAWRVAERSMAN